MDKNNHSNKYWILMNHIENITRPSSNSILIILAWFLSSYSYKRKIKQIDNIHLLGQGHNLEFSLVFMKNSNYLL